MMQLPNGQVVNVADVGMPSSETPVPVKYAVIVDLDGTLADHEERLKFIPSDPKGGDWTAFYRNQIDDPVFEGVAEIVRRLSNFFIVICTARPEKYRLDSEKWLAVNQIPYDAMMMRPDGDWRPNQEIKSDQLDTIISLGWDPFLAFEDHPGTIEMFRERGVETLAVSNHWEEYGDEFQEGTTND
jgi:hypothetical protein